MKTTEELENENEALKRRCYVLSQGAMCFFCPIKCEHRTTQFRGEEVKESETK